MENIFQDNNIVKEKIEVSIPIEKPIKDIEVSPQIKKSRTHIKNKDLKDANFLKCFDDKKEDISNLITKPIYNSRNFEYPLFTSYEVFFRRKIRMKKRKERKCKIFIKGVIVKN